MLATIIGFLQRAILQGTPLLFGATGEIITEKSGNLNLGIPGIMYIGAISGVIGGFLYQSNAGTAESTLAHTDAMYSLLKMQQRRNKIPANLPDGVKVANKTGELDDVENDAGIIYNTAKNIDLVVCFMSQDLTDSSEAQAVIAQDSRLIYGYYNE